MLLLRQTAVPPAGAGMLSVTVPCEVLPTGTLVRLRLGALRLRVSVGPSVKRVGLAVGTAFPAASDAKPPAANTCPFAEQRR